MPEQKQETIAPYNFVSLPNRIIAGEAVPNEDRYHVDRHTGWLDLQIKTLTPTYTRGVKGLGNFPDPVEPIEQTRQSPDFFHRGDKVPVLPGSSLRGMFRSVFEILTLSSMEFVSNRRLFYRSFADPRKSDDTGNAAGVKALYERQFTNPLKDGRVVGGIFVQHGDGFVLRVSRKSDIGFVLVRYEEFRDLFTERNQNSTQPCSVRTTDDKHDILGIPIGVRIPGGGGSDRLICPGKVVGKTGRTWGQVILAVEDGGYDDYQVPESVYEDYRAWGQAAHGSRFGTKDTPRELKNGQPSFALLDKSRKIVDVIGANMMMPMRYERSIDQAARVGASTDSEDLDSVLDMTQTVFGRVATGKGDKSASVRSRVFFEDAVCVTELPWLQDGPTVRTPDIMSGPKPTAFQDYIEQGGDIAINHWDSQGAKIRGHKRYWHRSASAALEALSQDPLTGNEKQTTRIQPVRAGVEFCGRLRFENLTDVELGALITSILLPKGMAHKFGMGKNLGLGSIRVNVKSTVLIEPIERYRSLSSGAGVIADPNPILQTAYRAFVGTVSPKERKSLWSKGRFLDFAAMAVWNREVRPVDDRTRQVSIGNRQAIEEDPQRGQWKARWVLPPPQAVLRGQLPGLEDIFPIAIPGSPEANSVYGQTTEAEAGTKIPDMIVYRQGQEIRGPVVDKDGFVGTVRLPDGRTLHGQSVGMCEVGGEYRFKILSVDSKGQIKGVKRA